MVRCQFESIYTYVYFFVQKHLQITPLVYDIVQGDEYIVSKEWQNLKSGDFLFYGNYVLGVLDKIVGDTITDKVAIYTSVHYIRAMFLKRPKSSAEN